MRRFVVVGQRATASGDYLLDDLPGTSGRIDVLLRCVRAALLYSNGVRRDVVVYLVLLGGERAPRALRVTGAEARFLRPDERTLAVLMKKVLGWRGGASFVEMKQGVALAEAGLDAVLADLGPATPFVLEEGAADLREAQGVDASDVVFFVGDDHGFDPSTRARIAGLGARPIGLGPISVHADDAVAVVTNELDRRAASPVASCPVA